MSDPLGSSQAHKPAAPTVLVVGASDTFVRRCREASGARAAVVGIPREALRSAASLLPRLVVVTSEVHDAERAGLDAIVRSSDATLVRVADETVTDESLKQHILGGLAPSGVRPRATMEAERSRSRQPVVLAVGCTADLADRCREIVGTFGHVLDECEPDGIKEATVRLRPVLIVVRDELYRRDPVELAAVSVDACAELAVLGDHLRPLDLAWLLVSSMRSARDRLPF